VLPLFSGLSQVIRSLFVLPKSGLEDIVLSETAVRLVIRLKAALMVVPKLLEILSRDPLKSALLSEFNEQLKHPGYTKMLESVMAVVQGDVAKKSRPLQKLEQEVYLITNAHDVDLDVNRKTYEEVKEDITEHVEVRYTDSWSCSLYIRPNETNIFANMLELLTISFFVRLLRQTARVRLRKRRILFGWIRTILES
jgi:hypothetical protein